MSGRYGDALVINGTLVINDYRFPATTYPYLTSYYNHIGDEQAIWLSPNAVLWVKRADLAPILFPDE